MGISTADIKELREQTGAGMLDCKKALEENDGDLDEAVDYLRKQGIASAEKKAGRTASEGLASVKAEGNQAVIAEINSETDFAAKNDKFQEVVDQMTTHLLTKQPADVDEALNQTLVGSDKTVEEYFNEAISQIGENLSFRRFKLIERAADEVFGTYIHMGGNIGVLTLLEGGDEDLARNVAMHIAAANPDYLSRDDVPAEDVEKEKQVLQEQAENEGKPEHIVEQIVKGRLNKFYNQNCLVEQEYIRDTDKTVGDLLSEADATIKESVRYEVGEGIEVEEEDFAEEVMSEVNEVNK
ncbi:translation elongation factor Ts [Halobacteroides halobius DSM 5150]|uniref:Elongation factor Ts n=1 Tax=Halobacteroides halobius (strain ATCC 35273 / DSM 5150 / MD-1) TaxID=748449 RepID=L0K8G2_HALHC|nr:translation elongation factor Ts [Halobacteroides halobius]AGB40659.1 translation elongation factor Ts [Halobacteroides halobius DSM 5150]